MTELLMTFKMYLCMNSSNSNNLISLEIYDFKNGPNKTASMLSSKFHVVLGARNHKSASHLHQAKATTSISKSAGFGSPETSTLVRAGL